MIYVSGPGHGGGNAMVAQDWLDGSYQEVYPNISRDKGGYAEAVQAVLLPRRHPVARRAGDSGSINEGGELGIIRWRTPFGAVTDNPGLIAACVVGDGEAGTGPLCDLVAAEQIHQPENGRRGAADTAPERL